MICNNCRNQNKCSTLKQLYNMSSDFSINHCKDYNSDNRYRKIAEHDDLMRLIYDYFTGQLVGVSEVEAKKAIECNMFYL